MTGGAREINALRFRVSDLRDLVLAEDRRLMRVVFEFEQVVEGIFQKERRMLNARAGEAAAGVLIELQALGRGAIRHRLPIVFGREDQTEVAGKDGLW